MKATSQFWKLHHLNSPTKLKTNVLPNISKDKKFKPSKAVELYMKMYFQIKFNKSGGYHNLVPWRIPWGIFAATLYLRPGFSYCSRASI